MPLVAIIIPAYNAAAFLEAAVDSALNQTHVEIEVLIVDDKSTDETCAIAQQLSESDARVTLLHNTGPKGPSSARNTGLRQAKGEWIALLDADDTFEPNRLTCMLAIAADTGADMLADNLELVEFRTKHSLGPALDPSWMKDEVPLTLSLLLVRDWPGRHTGRGIGFIKPLISRRFLETNRLEYDEDILAGEDLLLYARAIDAGARLILMPQRLYRYSVRSGSLSSGWWATDHLLEVNRRISKLSSGSEAEIDFGARHAAFVYQRFSSKLKSREWVKLWSGIDASSVPYIISSLFGAALRKLRPFSRAVSIR